METAPRSALQDGAEGFRALSASIISGVGRADGGCGCGSGPGPNGAAGTEARRLGGPPSAANMVTSSPYVDLSVPSEEEEEKEEHSKSTPILL